MTEPHRPSTGLDQPAWYEVRLKGHIDQQWGDWFEGMTSTTESDGTTVLSGPLIDQAALHGLLRKVGDLGMTLISVNVVEPDDVE
ncbi:hypothetical protein [Agromyces sp. Soil535]|uniref:hypothetical protein n=1 Tax=Agromyces sp. Soil535 TaxID=1736390 RepID=UPI0006FE2D62|nr:hypothetical protein [Agromyces sp. Soil535]KRE25849.1 hypothetical protein ASG80_21925 [Agromyces sp. Soil535]